MDKALDFESEDCGFDSRRDLDVLNFIKHVIYLYFFLNFSMYRGP